MHKSRCGVTVRARWAVVSCLVLFCTLTESQPASVQPFWPNELPPSFVAPAATQPLAKQPLTQPLAQPLAKQPPPLASQPLASQPLTSQPLPLATAVAQQPLQQPQQLLRMNLPPFAPHHPVAPPAAPRMFATTISGIGGPPIGDTPVGAPPSCPPRLRPPPSPPHASCGRGRGRAEPGRRNSTLNPRRAQASPGPQP